MVYYPPACRICGAVVPLHVYRPKCRPLHLHRPTFQPSAVTSFNQHEIPWMDITADTLNNYHYAAICMASSCYRLFTTGTCSMHWTVFDLHHGSGRPSGLVSPCSCTSLLSVRPSPATSSTSRWSRLQCHCSGKKLVSIRSRRLQHPSCCIQTSFFVPMHCSNADV